VHQIRFRSGLRRAYSTPPDPIAGLRGLLLRGREGKGWDRRGGEGGEDARKGQRTGELKGKGRDAREMGGKGWEREEGEEGKGRGGKKVITPPPSIPAYAPGIIRHHNPMRCHPLCGRYGLTLTES